MMTADRLASLTARDAAAEWLVARDLGLTEREKALFDLWLLEPAHHAEWERATRIWRDLATEDDLLMESMRESALSLKPPVHRRLSAQLAVVALVVLVVLLVVLTLQTRP
jgi:ferric-dicitrate binding protein FerR (iron transport regulator)